MRARSRTVRSLFERETGTCSRIRVAVSSLSYSKVVQQRSTCPGEANLPSFLPSFLTLSLSLPTRYLPVVSRSRSVAKEKRTQSPEFAAAGDRGPANFDSEYTGDTGYASPALIQVKMHFLGRALMVANEPQWYARARDRRNLPTDFPPFDLIGGFRVSASRTYQGTSLTFLSATEKSETRRRRRSAARDNVVRIATSNELCNNVRRRFGCYRGRRSSSPRRDVRSADLFFARGSEVV